MDHINLKGIKAYGYVGFFAEEQKLGQWFCADLNLAVDLRAAAENDDLEMTVNYAQIVTETQKQIATSRAFLLETLADNILEMILRFEKVQSAEIILTKLAPPIPNFSGTVAVQMTRTKQGVS